MKSLSHVPLWSRGLYPAPGFSVHGIFQAEYQSGLPFPSSLAPWKEIYDKTFQHITKQRHHFATKLCIVETIFFSAVMYRYKSWTVRKPELEGIDAFELWCSLDIREIKDINPKGNQTKLFIWRTDAEVPSTLAAWCEQLTAASGGYSLVARGLLTAAASLEEHRL